jgi:hypothetical protein
MRKTSPWRTKASVLAGWLLFTPAGRGRAAGGGAGIEQLPTRAGPGAAVELWGVGVTADVTDGRGVSMNDGVGLGRGLAAPSGPRRPRRMVRINATTSAPTAVAATIRRDRGFIAG